ncbi:MAG: siroheme synthase CysG [Methylobacillus sp.]|jgi:uroporphyrin-III C-methyltransferase/precorrin-2 dehydrogenase/sirohydrochlorin ferrochelatase|nr:siroheme synthase CysG [Methylobacillus sp.]
MDYLPIFIRLRGCKSIVVGGGEIALRKVSLLLRADAEVTVIAPELCAALATEKRIAHLAARFSPEQLDGARLVVAATDDADVNRAVSEAAQARAIPVNVVDAPDLCTFVMPSVVDRSPVVIAVSSGGNAPVLARMVRARLETLIPASYGHLAQLAGEFRDKVKARFKNPRQRLMFWESVFQGSVAERVFAGQEKKARQQLEAMLRDETDVAQRGEVYLVGSGPGDPDLLTFRALRLMQQCDVVLYDKLVSAPIMDLVRRDAERIYVGKQRAQHALPQDDINQLLTRLAKEGKRVLRLKGGDPFIFGRGGEEIETLMENGIPFQVVPGITAASGVASYAGIPLTHRDHAQSCIFATGHLRDGTVDLDWPTLTRPNQTVVIYMGLVGLPEICRQLIAHGLPANTPAAVVQQGTTPQQRVVVADVEHLSKAVETAELRAPCLIIVGSVVSLREKLNWFEAG